MHPVQPLPLRLAKFDPCKGRTQRLVQNRVQVGHVRLGIDLAQESLGVNDRQARSPAQPLEKKIQEYRQQEKKRKPVN